MARFFLIMFLYFINYSAYAYVVDGLKIYDQNLFQYVKQSMPRTGVLKKDKTGAIYVSIDKRYIKGILEKVKDQKYQFNTSRNNINAQIEVISSEETKGKKIVGTGKRVEFNPLGFYKVVIDDKEYLMLAIDSPELASFRAKHGLNPKLKGKAFSIVLGVRKFQDDGEDELVSVR